MTSPAADAVLAAKPSPKLPRLGRQARLRLFIAGVWLFAAVLASGTLPAFHAPGSYRIPWWALAFFFYLAETNVVHLHFRREAHTLSLNELPLVVGLFFTPPEQLVLAIVLGSAAALVIHRRQPAVKLAFNIGQFTASALVAIVVFHLTGAGRVDGPRYWVAAFAAVTVAALASILAVTIAIYLADGSNTLRSIPRITVIALTGAFANASLALLVVEVLYANSAALVLLLLPSAAAVFAFRAYTKQAQRHKHLTHLYETMQATHTSPEVDGAVRELLAASKRIFEAEIAELVLSVPERGEVFRSTLSPQREWLMQPTRLRPEEFPFIDEGELADGAVLMRRASRGRTIHPYLAARKFKDAMIAPLRADDAIVGMLVVADRSSDVTSFTPDDRRLFEAFAAHAGILLDNDGKLRHQAFHDALTGLPNRRMILHETTAALHDRRAARGPSLLFLDLDDFKTVNDSLGHSAGDKLLTAVAAQLKDAIRPADTAARLGGDEFAILLRNASLEEAEATTARILESFEKPFHFGLDEISIHPTIGIAVAEGDVRDAEDMLRNADLAMYSVKGESKQRYAAYRPEMHYLVRKRHELIAALERAVESDEIVVQYQPIVDLETGRLAAFEALVRWQSDSNGLLSPAEFLPAAEETGLIIPIGKAVLEQAVRQLRAWQTAHFLAPEVAMAVNLSAREIHDVALPGRVSELLRSTGLHPRSLILELTEGSAMIDFDSTLETLRELRKLGVLVALDDFGTGHSSLSHLWELPIDLIKIGSPFTDRIGNDGTPLARAVFNFAGSLPLAIVAECIETADQAEALKELHCTYGQGYYFAAPLNPADAERFIRSGKPLRAVHAA